jgi:trafficking protein particle complex subunit 10
MWQDILGKIKECVLQSFDSRVLQYEEDIRKMDSQRTLPGWNYCTFFILKEGLAQSFEHMLLLEDALIQYDELEASFFQLLRGELLCIGPAHGRQTINVVHADWGHCSGR